MSVWLKRLISGLFGPSQPPRRPYSDPLLGTLEPDECGWEVEVATPQGDVVCFHITGEREFPSQPGLERARAIYSEFDEFRARVHAFLERESEGLPAEAASEIASLKVKSVSIFREPTNGMIFFEGPADELRLWRCDVVDGIGSRIRIRRR